MDENEVEKEIQKGNLIRQIIFGVVVLAFLLIRFIIPFISNVIEHNQNKIETFETTSSSISEDTYYGDIYLEIPDVPFEVSSLYYSGKISSTYEITDIQCETKNVLGNYITYIDVSGTKIYDIKGDKNSDNSLLSWKIYDINDDSLVIDSGHLFLPDLCAGEKFEKISTNTSKLEKGRKYKLVFYDE